MSEDVNNAKPNKLSRRRFIKLAAISAAALPAGSALLAACGDTATSGATAGPTAGSTTTSAAATTTSAAATTTTAAATTTTAAGAATTAAATTTAAAGGSATTTAAALSPVPAVPNAAAAKKYSGTTIVFNGDSVGSGQAFDAACAAQFTKDTGINVKIIPHPSDSDAYYASLQRVFQGQSSEIDVMMLDVIWPGAFAQYLYDLTPDLGADSKAIYESAVQNDTVNGKLVAMPYFGDFGMLYYRKDLLQKYGYSNPPQTWDDLEAYAKKIVDGEKASNSSFTGFTWQGKAYEGLTCDALEWLASSGGGTIIDDKGNVTVNNPQAAAAITKAKGWVGTISPSGVTSYDESAALAPFTAGNSAFMRNWPYAYAIGNDPSQSKIAGKFDVAPLPHGAGGQSVGTLGGWQLGVNKFSKNPGPAVEFVRYLTSQEISTWRAVNGSYVPLNMKAATDPSVLKAEPFLASMANVTRVTRPSTAAGTAYNQISGDFFQGVSKILSGSGDATATLADVANRIKSALH